LAARLLFFTGCVLHYFDYQCLCNPAVFIQFCYSFPWVKKVCQPCVTGRLQTPYSWTVNYCHLNLNMAIRPSALGYFKSSFQYDKD
jgi:hypothetical protein